MTICHLRSRAHARFMYGIITVRGKRICLDPHNPQHEIGQLRREAPFVIIGECFQVFIDLRQAVSCTHQDSRAFFHCRFSRPKYSSSQLETRKYQQQRKRQWRGPIFSYLKRDYQPPALIQTSSASDKLRDWLAPLKKTNSGQHVFTRRRPGLVRDTRGSYYRAVRGTAVAAGINPCVGPAVGPRGGGRHTAASPTAGLCRRPAARAAFAAAVAGWWRSSPPPPSPGGATDWLGTRIGLLPSWRALRLSLECGPDRRSGSP